MFGVRGAPGAFVRYPVMREGGTATPEGGKAHAFYGVVTRDQAGTVTGGELRHVRESKCPMP